MSQFKPSRAVVRQACSAVFILSVLATLSPAYAEVDVCLEDGQGNALRFVWVQHWLTDRMTDVDGCVTFDADGEIDIRVFAHNPVVRMDDGRNFTFPVSQEVQDVTDGQRRAVPAQGAFWRIAEEFRDAYNRGLREFPPWNDAKFPAGNVREPSREDLIANSGVIRVTWPDETIAVRAWTEGAALTTVPFGVYVGFPLIHLKEPDGTDHTTIAHELGHALHFAKLPNHVRTALEVSYGMFLAVDADRSHCFDKRTNDTVAWIEAFGIFAEEFEAANGTGAAKHRDFFDRAAALRTDLLDGEDCGSTPDNGVMFGPDVEGAVFLTLFHDFARHASVGLPLVVESYVSCTSLDITGYASCIRDRHGEDSNAYQALLSAAGCHGIELAGLPQALAGRAEAGDRFGASVIRGDFNGDGFGDLAIGSPHEAIGAVPNAGMVSVLYGLPGGLTTQCNQTFSQNTLGISGRAEEGDRFGEALAAGDFNGDGFSDLAISAPAEDLGTGASATIDAGLVTVLLGSIRGLQPEGSTVWTETRVGRANGIPALSGGGDHLGLQMASGDFNGDRADDLAVSVTGENIGAFDVGAVLVVYGQLNTGLQEVGGRLITQPEVVEQFDYFGSSLAVGHFDGDHFADLAVGANGEQVGSSISAGAVSVFFGEAAGLGPARTRHFEQGATLVGTPDAGDLLGTSVAFGDFNSDGRDDLAVGAPGEDVASFRDAGAVAVVYGATRQARTGRNELWTEDSGVVPGQAAEGDRFGESLATGDFNGDNHADLAVGITRDDLGRIVDAGAVTVLYGAPDRVEPQITSSGLVLSIRHQAGLDDDLSQRWTQNTPGILNAAQQGDRLGQALAAGELNGDLLSDLVIGSPLDEVGRAADAGLVNLLRGGGTGITAANDQLWHQDK